MKLLLRNNYLITLRSNWKKFIVNIVNCWNVYLNVLIKLATVWNELSNNVTHCFGMDYLLTLRIFNLEVLAYLEL